MLRTLIASLFVSVVAAQGWVDRTPSNPANTPSIRQFPAMCWDQAHGYVLMYGGLSPLGVSTETWTWNGTAWTRRFTAQIPYFGGQVGQSTAMVFHPPGNEVVMVNQASTWSWTGTDWALRGSTIGSTQNGPPYEIALAHDPVRSQTVLFVGTRFNGGPNQAGETFVWDGFGWSPRPTPVTPWPVQYPTMAFDPVAGRLVLGTSYANTTIPGAFFEWTGTNWQQRLPAGAPATIGTLVTDTVRQRVVMFDGVMNNQPNHTWTLANGALQQLATPSEPTRRFGGAMAFDPVRGKVVLFGGGPAPNTQGWSLGDTWEFELGAGASFTAFGAGCTGSRGVPTLAASLNSLPRVGQTFQTVVTNLPLQGPAFVFLGLSNTSYGGTPLPFSLGGLGAPGCFVRSSGDDIGVVTNVLGTGIWQWAVPNAPGASFYVQAFAFDAPANALGITSSNGAAGVIGF